MKKIYILLLFAPFLMLTSCRKDEVEIVVVHEEENPPRIYHDANVTGRVINKDGEPIRNASVNLYEKLTYTDDDGNFSFVNTKVNAAGSLLIIKANGYNTCIKAIHAERNNVVSKNIELFELTNPNYLTDSNEVLLSEEAKLFYTKSIFKYENGVDFEGDATLYFNWYDSKMDLNRFPLSIYATNFSTSKGHVIPSSGFTLKVVDQDGEELFIREGKSLDLTLGALNAPNGNFYEIDNSTEEWTAIASNLVEGKYELSISKLGHFLFGSMEIVNTVKGRMIDANGELLANKSFYVETEGISYKYQTNAIGEFKFSGVKDNDYTLTVTDDCGMVVNNNSFSVLSSGVTDLNNIELESNSTALTFKLFNCDLTPYAPVESLITEVITNGVSHVQRFDNNQIEMDGLWCDKAVEIIIKDGNKVLRKLDVSEVKLGKENDLFRVYLCDENIGGFISVDNETDYVNRSNLYIKTESAGMYDPLTFTDLSEFTMSINEAYSTGLYTPDELDVISPALLKCNGDCNDLSIMITVFGNEKNDRIIAHLFGNIDGKEVKGYFNALKYN